MRKTKNDKAWETLFDRHRIPETIQREGSFMISSADINLVRESRLMSKFDHFINLPTVFRDNSLTILPNSRSSYIIGPFDAYQRVEYSSEQPVTRSFPPEIESIDYTNIYSESAALLCAFNAGLIDDLFGAAFNYTVGGRMSSGKFHFTIDEWQQVSRHRILVENSQCEVDAGFESKELLVVVEAKNEAVEDFHLRQLFYPYRRWRPLISKQVIPVLMTYSNDVFSFFVYRFDDEEHYNSARLELQKHYTLAAEGISLDDIVTVLHHAEIVPEQNVPFPQADSFDRVVDLLGLLMEGDLTKEEITENYQFDRRQTDYYANAAAYLKLVSTSDGKVALNPAGKSIMRSRYRDKYLSLFGRILSHEPFNLACKKALAEGAPPETSEIVLIMKRCRLWHVKAESTIRRRASTIRQWLRWMFDKVNLD